MFDIITVGSSTVDVFATTDKKYVKKGAYCLPIGSKILVDELRTFTGGGGTNTAVAFSRLGLKTAYIGKMGSGLNAIRILKELKKEKVSIDLISHKGGKTGYSVIIDAKHHDRTIFTFKGTNNDLKATWLDVIKPKMKTKWFYFSAMLGESFKTQEKIAKYAKENGIKIALNPSCYLAEMGYKKLKNIIDNTTAIILNKEEAKLLTKKRTLKDCFKEMISWGIEYIIITDGPRGTTAFHKGKYYKSICHNVKIVETTGAGDAFAATFIAAIIRKKDMKDALALAQVNAESVITHYGAKNKLLKYKELLKATKKYKTKVKSIKKL